MARSLVSVALSDFLYNKKQGSLTLVVTIELLKQEMSIREIGGVFTSQHQLGVSVQF